MTKIEPRLLKGFRDYGLTEQATRQGVFRKIQSVFEQYGFLPLATPILEYKDILMGKYGDDQKLVYSFKDHGDREVAIRYDLTVPMARYVAQNQGRLSLPFKRYQIAPVLRADNPQKGRLREFYQCDVDAVGTDSPLADAEVIACLCQAIETLGINNYVVKINDRQLLEGLSPEAIRSLDKVAKIGIGGMTAEMKEKGLSDEEINLAAKIASAKQESVIPESIDKLKQLIFLFDIKGKIEFDATIARGLDYYTSTVFEIVLPDKPEYGTICAGGRYDGLVDQFSDQSLPAVGGSLGIDRLWGAMEEMGLLSQVSPVAALVLNLDDGFIEKYAELVTTLRNNGVNVELYYSAVKLDKQFKYAESKNIPFAIIMGESEIEKQTVLLKNLLNREQEELPIAKVVARLKQESDQ